MMLLDLPSIAQKQQLVNEMRSATRVVEEEAIESRKTHPIMLFTGLDGRRRAVRLELVRRIDTIAREAIDIDGARVQAVIDGAIYPRGLEHGELTADRCRLLRLSDGDSEIVYAVREVSMLPNSRARSSHGCRCHDRGVALIDERPVPVSTAMRCSRASGGRQGPAPVVPPPADSDWARAMLEPLVEAAGYRIAVMG